MRAIVTKKCLCFAMTVLLAAGSSWASTITVTNLDDSGTGSLRQAILDANDEILKPGADTIVFANGLYTGGSATISLSGAPVNDAASLGKSAVVISSNITIQGPAATGALSDKQLTVAGGGSGNQFRFATVGTTGSLALSNVTLTNFYEKGGNGAGGFAPSYQPGSGGGGLGAGGAILNYKGTLNLSGVTISNCTARGGNGGSEGSTSWTNRTQGGGGGMGWDATGTVAGGPNGATSSTPAGVGGGGAGNAGTAAAPGGFGGGGSAGTGTSAQGYGGGFGGGGGGDNYGGVSSTINIGGFGAGRGGSSSGNNAGGGGGGAGMGGAIFNLGGTVDIENSTLTGNSAVGGNGGNAQRNNGSGGNGLGGAIFNLNGTVALYSSTIYDNSVAGGANGTKNTTSGSIVETPVNGGAGIYNLSSGQAQVMALTTIGSMATLPVYNTIVGQTGATRADIVNTVVSAGAGATSYGTSMNCVSNNTLGTSFVGTANSGGTVGTGAAFAGSATVGDPLLHALASNGGPTQTMLPYSIAGGDLSNSPAIGAGTSAGAPSVDQRGVARGSTVDIGAVQVTAAGAVPEPAGLGLIGAVLLALKRRRS